MATQIEHRQIGRSVEYIKIWMCMVCGQTRAVKDTH
jgi:hypothetical protein